MGGGGVKNYQKLRDVIYGRPIDNKTEPYKIQSKWTFHVD
jgi:hypothetical protein